MTEKQRCPFEPDQKIVVPKKHLTDRIAVCDICEKKRFIQPNFIGGRKPFLDLAFGVFETAERSDEDYENQQSGAAKEPGKVGR